MKKDELLKNIAESAYNIGFGAKKHFATYDIVEKAPNWIGLCSLAIGIISLVYEPLSTKGISTILVIIGVSGIYITFYSNRKNEYDYAGKELTKLLEQLRNLYYEVKPLGNECSEQHVNAYTTILNKAHDISISKQIFLSDWYAHYKFFWQAQIGWINEQLNFRLFRDKIPPSLLLVVFIAIIAIIANSNYFLGFACGSSGS